jgi:hypothetical protein
MILSLIQRWSSSSASKVRSMLQYSSLWYSMTLRYQLSLTVYCVSTLSFMCGCAQVEPAASLLESVCRPIWPWRVSRRPKSDDFVFSHVLCSFVQWIVPRRTCVRICFHTLYICVCLCTLYGWEYVSPSIAVPSFRPCICLRHIPIPHSPRSNSNYEQ